MSWDIVRAGARIELLGSVEATDERDAIEKAAKEFKTDPSKLLAVKRSQLNSRASRFGMGVVASQRHGRWLAA
jgi:hypothetical protein